MDTIVALFKDIFSFNGNDSTKIGLSQFTNTEPIKKTEPKNNSRNRELKLSDLMRKSY